MYPCQPLSPLQTFLTHPHHQFLHLRPYQFLHLHHQFLHLRLLQPFLPHSQILHLCPYQLLHSSSCQSLVPLHLLLILLNLTPTLLPPLPLCPPHTHCSPRLILPLLHCYLPLLLLALLSLFIP
jgi:hypothetical protein